MDIRIGITQAPRELSVEMNDDVALRDALKANIDKALKGELTTLWITDKKGRDIAVAASKIAYIEVGTGDDAKRIGFGG